MRHRLNGCLFALNRLIGLLFALRRLTEIAKQRGAVGSIDDGLRRPSRNNLTAALLSPCLWNICIMSSAATWMLKERY
jgi:hypothetical protein